HNREKSLILHMQMQGTQKAKIYITEAHMTKRDSRQVSCWCLLMNIENFVQLSTEVPAKELARMVGTWLGECQLVIEKYGGTVSKFLGDGVLVYWNAKFCERVKVIEALRVLHSMQSRRQPPFRWTMHYGKAIFSAAVKAGE